ncbi:unnamed protein product [Spirodela intermedia]|uniref:Uncharacterized protein n=1 Tax=Spirodela intermedia TaxID=51605 RepID=A0A7I8IFN0_SPIIN|nr:unnamed protein product [Spirodela intermedia]CAA6656620.1 unnamed protein product [Spirodela intermedia]
MFWSQKHLKTIKDARVRVNKFLNFLHVVLEVHQFLLLWA